MKYPDVTLGRVEAVWNKLGGEGGVNRFLRGELVILEPPKPKLLEFVGTISVSAVKEFVAKKKFVINIGDNALVKVSYLGDNFREQFLGKIEKSFPGSELRYQKLMKSSVDDSIINKLGGKAKAETTLAEVFSLMEKQGNGQSGALLTNGWWNIFYVHDINGVLRTVLIYWSGVGWHVDAHSAEHRACWFADYLVFSRNS